MPVRLLTACLCVLSLLFLPAKAHADPQPVSVTDEAQSWSLVETLAVARSIPGEANSDEVVAGKFDHLFKPGTGAVPNVDGSEGTLWVKTSIRNERSKTAHLQIVLKYPQPTIIDFHVMKDSGEVMHRRAGSAVAMDSPMAGRFPHMPVILSPGESATILVRLESSGPILVPLELFTQLEFGQAMTRDYLIFGLLIGIVMAIAIHSALIFGATREPAFGWFVLFAIGGAGFILTGTGIAKAIFWPDLAFHSNAVLMAAQGLANTASALFLASYLNTAERAPRLHKCIMAIALVAVVSCFSSFLPDVLDQFTLIIVVLVGPSVLFAATVYLAWRQLADARTLLFGWTFIQAGTIWICLRAFDVVPYTEFNHYALPLAITLAALKFSWALTSRARQAEHRASHDPLTGLPNRFKLNLRATQSGPLKRRIAGVLHVDLDSFKNVNDTLGHAAGDEVLRTVAKRIADAIHGEGKIYRMGGDEFVVLVDARRKNVNLVGLANRIIIASSQPITVRGEDASIGASVGLAVPQSSDENLAEVIERADAALYNAKRAGKGRVEVCDLANQRELLQGSMGTLAA